MSRDCSLREAISAANERSGADTVLLRGRRTYSIEIPGDDDDLNARGDFDVAQGDLTITRSGRGRATIDASGLDRALDLIPDFVAPSIVLEVAHLTIRGGVHDRYLGAWSGAAKAGGGIRGRGGELRVLDSRIVSNHALNGGGGGIYALGDLTATHSAISSNEVLSGNAVYGGAGISARGDLKLSDVTVRDNISANSGGGVLWSAGFIGSRASLQAVSIVENDAATSGGGLDVAAGAGNPATITKSTIAGNGAGQRGGGVYTSAETRIVKSTLSGNDAGVNGGGIANVTEGGGLPGALITENDTVAGNSAASFGGGIDVYDGATAALNNVTVAYNDADSDSLGPGQGGGVQNGSTNGAVTLGNSLIALNSGATGDDCAGFSFASIGHNLLSTSAGCTGIGATGDREVAMPMIAELAANGGPTKTIALRRGSAAINHGGGDCTKTDQRGVRRRDCDIGAYERR